MKTRQILLTTLMVTTLLVTGKISAQSSFNTKVYSTGTEIEHVLGIEIHQLASWETKFENDLPVDKTIIAPVVDVTSLEKYARYYPTNLDINEVSTPETSMDDILKDLYKNTKFNPADYLEN